MLSPKGFISSQQQITKGGGHQPHTFRRNIPEIKRMNKKESSQYVLTLRVVDDSPVKKVKG